MHRVRKRRQLAVVRALWERRDEVARRRDIAPGRVLPDAALVAAALAGPRTEADLVALPVWGGRSMRRQTATWLPAIEEALDLPGRRAARPARPRTRDRRRPRSGASATRPPRPGSRPPGRPSAPIAERARAAGREPARARTPYAGWPGRRPTTPWPGGTDAVAAFLRDHGARAVAGRADGRAVLPDALVAAGRRHREPDA